MGIISDKENTYSFWVITTKVKVTGYGRALPDLVSILVCVKI